MFPALPISVLVSLACGFGDPPAAQDIKYQTSDGVTIGADFFAPKIEKGAKAPVVILIHMYPLDRKSWGPLIGPLHDVGFAVLAYDVRGRGASVEPAKLNLRERYGERDNALFQSAWHDAEGAVTWLAKRDDCDITRIGVAGASVGAGIAIDFAKRTAGVKAILGMSPYPEILGIKTEEDIKQCTSKAILLMSPEREYGKVLTLVEATKGAARHERYIGGPGQHGTNLLDEPIYGHQVVATIVDFFKAPLGLAPAASTDPKKTPAKR